MLLNQQNQPVKIVGTVQDITEIAAIETACMYRMNCWKTFFTKEMLLWVIDRQGICVFQGGVVF
jgi:hypothetical protein